MARKELKSRTQKRKFILPERHRRETLNRLILLARPGGRNESREMSFTATRSGKRSLSPIRLYLRETGQTGNEE